MRIGKEEDQKCFWRNYGWKLSKPEEGNRFSGLGNTEGPKQISSRHIIIKVVKVKNRERVLKVAREKQRVNYKEIPTSLSTDFSAETV